MPALLVQRAARLRSKPNLDQRFLRYLIASSEFTNYVLGIQTGSAVPHISKRQLEAFRFSLPPMRIQQAIADVLASLDDKIELNKCMNRTLEAVGQALFKSWFVDFEPVKAKAAGESSFRGLPQVVFDRLPNSFVESELGPTLSEWLISALKDASLKLRRGIQPKYIDEGGVLVINQSCVRDQQVDLTEARRHDSERRAIDGLDLRVGDVLVNSTGTGTLGRVGQITNLDETTICDSHVTFLRPNPELVTTHFWGAAIRCREREIENLGYGSTGQTELSRESLGALKLIVPPLDVQWAFESMIDPTVRLHASNKTEIRRLFTMRATLLPKLISGEFQIPLTERQNAE